MGRSRELARLISPSFPPEMPTARIASARPHRIHQSWSWPVQERAVMLITNEDIRPRAGWSVRLT
jgi:hypothetical protein